MHLRDGILKWVRENTDEHDQASVIATGIAHALATVLRDATATMDDAATHRFVTDVCGAVMQHVLQRGHDGHANGHGHNYTSGHHGLKRMIKMNGRHES